MNPSAKSTGLQIRRKSDQSNSDSFLKIDKREKDKNYAWLDSVPTTLDLSSASAPSAWESAGRAFDLVLDDNRSFYEFSPYNSVYNTQITNDCMKIAELKSMEGINISADMPIMLEVPTTYNSLELYKTGTLTLDTSARGIALEDYQRVQSDWSMVGADLYASLADYDKQT